MLTASSAKINLFLEVYAKLPNNYHQVNTVLCSIDLFDYLSYDLLPTPKIELSCNVPELCGEHNLVFRIALYLQQYYHVAKGVRIHLDKNIPLAAGLGGGSSNAANCLLNLNHLWSLHLSEQELHQIASRFGSDLNFFLVGGTALGESRGEIITPLPHLDIKNILLVNPNIPIPASLAYQLVQLPQACDLRVFDPDNLPQSCFNRLEAGIRKSYPTIDNIITSLNQQGAIIAMMSGSGSTCFGIFDDLDVLSLSKTWFDQKGYWTYLAQTMAPGTLD